MSKEVNIKTRIFNVTTQMLNALTVLRLCAFVVFLFLHIPAISQSDSLLHYLEIAARNNPSVLQKYAEYQAALQKVPQAGSLQDPLLSLGYFLEPMELINGRQRADITLMQMFPWFGVLRNAKDEMSLMANAKFEEFRDTKLQVYYDVQRTWYELYKIRKNIDITGRNIEILKVIEDLALVRYRTASAGSGSSPRQSRGLAAPSGNGSSGAAGGMQGMNQGRTSSPDANTPQPSGMQDGSMDGSLSGTGLADLYRIRIETGDLGNNLALLKSREQTIAAQVNRYLNRPPLFPVFTTDTLVAVSFEISAAAVSDSIFENNPMLGMLKYEKQAYSARGKMAKWMGYPMVGLGLNYSVIGNSMMAVSPEMNGKDMVMPMASITLPVYRKKYKAIRKEADLLTESSSLNFQATANDLQAEYYAAMQMYQDAKRRVELYDDQSLLASKSLDLILSNFSSSAAGLSDVLRIRQQTLEYELSKVEAVTDLNTAIALLKRLMATSLAK